MKSSSQWKRWGHREEQDTKFLSCRPQQVHERRLVARLPIWHDDGAVTWPRKTKQQTNLSEKIQIGCKLQMYFLFVLDVVEQESVIYFMKPLVARWSQLIPWAA